MLIKSLPEDERPIEKTLKQGVGALSNTELLALIIHTGTRNSSSLHLAEEVLSVCEEGLSSMGSMGLDDLMQISGIGSGQGMYHSGSC
jgi:DNA repair protein RadC